MKQLRSSLTSLSWLIKMIILFICYYNFTTFSYHNYQLFKFHHYHYHPLYHHQHHHFSFILRLSQHSNNDYSTHHSLQKLSHRYHLSSLSSSSSKTSSSPSSSFQLYQSISPSDEIIGPAIYSSDLYEVLGLLRNASKAQIKDAYWTIASRNHPDR